MDTRESLSYQDFADKIPQTRMDLRLAMRASLRYNTLPPLEHQERCIVPSHLAVEEVLSAGPCYVIKPSTPEAGKFAPDEVKEVIADIEDDAWLNDVAQPRSRDISRTPISKEQWANDHTLMCWL